MAKRLSPKRPRKSPAPNRPPPARPLVRRTPPLRTAPVASSGPSLRVPEPEVRSLPFEIDPKKLDQGLAKIKGELTHWVNKGRYTKVRIKLFDKPLLPDLPIGVVAAAEGLSFMLLGPLQSVLGNLVGTAVLNVELISDALHHVNRGRELILAGELQAALAQFRTALAIDRGCAAAHLHIGIALKLQGDRMGARLSFEKAAELDPKGPSGLEAEKLLATLR
jgi:tetratricopeptide (TPR) repeat protein